MQRRTFLGAAATLTTLPTVGATATSEDDGFPFPVPDNYPFCGELLQDASDDGLHCPGCDSTMPAGFYSTVAYRGEFDMRIAVPVGVSEQTLAIARDRLGENPDRNDSTITCLISLIWTSTGTVRVVSDFPSSGITTTMAITHHTRRVTARILRTEGGETFTEFQVGGVSYSSLDELESVLNNR